MKKFTEVMEISGVPVYAHWSLFLIGALILIGAIERPAETIAAWASFFGVGRKWRFLEWPNLCGTHYPR